MVRRMEETDLDSVMQIWLESNIKAHDFIPKEYWENNFASVREMVFEAEVYVYVTGCGGEVAGFLGMMEDYLAGIFVRGGMRSRGIGKCLLCFAKKEKRRLSLHVYRKNERALRFYEREGFLRREETADRGTGEMEILMEWEKG